jgi:multicomponent Na+:H+ antiporter subunit D
MIGLPPAAGFVSKWYMLSGAMAQAALVALAVILLSTLLNAGYFLPIVYRAFFRPLSAGRRAHPHGEAPLPMVLALCPPRRHAGAVLLPRRAAGAGATTGDDGGS